MGDGCIYETKGSNYIACLVSTSKLLAQTYSSAMESLGMHVRTTIDGPDKTRYGKKPMYRVVGQSKQFYDFYRSLTLEKLKYMLQINNEHTLAFLRGFYEAEGSLKKRGDLSISNSNVALLELIKDLLLKIGIECWVRGPYKWGTNRKPMYLIQVGERKARKFLSIIQPCIRNQHEQDEPHGIERARWTENELKILRSGKPINNLINKLKNRTKKAMQTKRERLRKEMLTRDTLTSI